MKQPKASLVVLNICKKNYRLYKRFSAKTLRNVKCKFDFKNGQTKQMRRANKTPKIDLYH